ncbi:interleukin-21 receptor [Hyperolius riggenbachi]|uniref:interleukin-21 receptor n=1 Tax=Hyperolius riggenbachi TaxID=752182 RepID=UPI0035A37B31
MSTMNRKSTEVVSLLLFFLCFTTGRGCRDLACHLDFINTLTCIYRSDNEETSDTPYILDAKWDFEESEDVCELFPSERKDDEYICIIDMEDFNSDTYYTISVHDNVSGNKAAPKTCGPYSIIDKFKPVAPFNLTVSYSEDYNKSWNISWKTLYDTDIYRGDNLAYELRYKKVAESWQDSQIFNILEDVKNLEVRGSLFEAGEMYTARIRARPKNTSVYKGSWSDWSAAVSWRAPPDGRRTEAAWQNWTISLMALFALMVAVILFAFRWPKCLWKNVWVLIPDPGKFFKPLYMVHHGDFKSWLGASYYHTTSLEENMAFPEVFEVYNPGLLKNVARLDLSNTEKQKLLMNKMCSSKDSQDCRRCDCMKAAVDETPENLPAGTLHCPHFVTMNGEEAGIHRSGDDSYPYANDGYPYAKLGNDNRNMLYLKSDHESEVTTSSSVDPSFQEILLRSNMNILDLVSLPPEEFPFQESPSQDDDENVFYNDNYNALSPDSETSADFGYPRVCLDLDTIDSGFCDSECGSPVDSDFGNNGMPPKPLNSDSYSGEEEIYERNYVKQWVPSHCTSTES